MEKRLWIRNEPLGNLGAFNNTEFTREFPFLKERFSSVADISRRYARGRIA